MTWLDNKNTECRRPGDTLHNMIALSWWLQGKEKRRANIDRTVTIAARTPPRREFSGSSCCSLDRGLLYCADSINAECINAFVTRDQ